MGCLIAGLVYVVIWVAFLPLSFCVATPYILLRSALVDGAYWPEVRGRHAWVWSYWLTEVSRYMRLPDVGD